VRREAGKLFERGVVEDLELAVGGCSKQGGAGVVEAGLVCLVALPGCGYYGACCAVYAYEIVIL
jgi:hypothetical protein